MKQIRWGDAVVRAGATCPALSREMASLGIDIQAVLNAGGVPAVAGLAYCLMFDEDGRPPSDLSEAQFMEAMPGTVDSTVELLGASLAALTNGRVDRQTICQLLESAIEAQLRDLSDLLQRILSASGTKKDDWCAEKGFSRSNVYEFLKDGPNSRVRGGTQLAIERAILDDAQQLGVA